jgi:hypothetical protein
MISSEGTPLAAGPRRIPVLSQPVLSIDKARYLVYPMSRRRLSSRALSPVSCPAASAGLPAVWHALAPLCAPL